MPRQPRHTPGGLAYHILNRAAGRLTLFRTPGDYAAFIRCLDKTLTAIPIRLCAYCLMPNHWHLILWPEHDGQLARFMQRLTISHARHWIEFHHRVGQGSIYQGRYKSFPIEEDGHFATAVRYIERNPLRANLVKNATQWPWSSVAPKKTPETPLIPISRWPVSRRRDWLDWLNQPQTGVEEDAMKRSITRSYPLGDIDWTANMLAKLGLPPLKDRGRPRKEG